MRLSALSKTNIASLVVIKVTIWELAFIMYSGNVLLQFYLKWDNSNCELKEQYAIIFSWLKSDSLMDVLDNTL